jgi:hypothetical protein
MKLHEDAKDNYNEKARSVLCKVKNIPQFERKPINLQRYNSGTISGKNIIGDIVVNYKDDDGLNCGFSFFHNGQNMGLIGDDYVVIKRMIESLVRNKDNRSVLNYAYVEDKCIKWFIGTIKKNEVNDFIEYLENVAEKDIKEHSIWIPIPFTTIEHDFSFGNIEIKTLTEEIIDNWFKREDTHKKNDSNRVEDYLLAIKKEYQGFAFGVIKVVAVKQRAKEIAYEKISDVLSFIRIFLPANRDINKRSGLYEYGWKMNENEDYFAVDENGKCYGLNQAIRDMSIMGHMSSDFINMIVNSKFNSMLCNNERTEFEQDVYSSILIYSKSSLKSDTFDRLLYIFSALEMLLLKNNTEPIQQNLADRMAYACANSIDGRRKIVDLVKKVYEARSRYVHHGQSENIDKQLINEFLRLSWKMYINIVHNVHIATNRLDFIEQLELIKYS